ncbi:helix-turn-helix transcriptional regulator [Ornithinibacillus sp. FSL M8-0202]|uniref:helix-turn-helix transcriptional regulator n=1 Tax=Ornithinibacillus sp. FSL M8-0202 TaxID=2921616 RepID=UPI0030CDD11E
MKLTIDVVLKEELKRRNISQNQLAEMTNIRKAAISELINNQRRSINKEHLIKIAEALEITDITKLLVIKETIEKSN